MKTLKALACALSALAVLSGSATADVPVIVVSPYLVSTPIARAGSTVSVVRREDIEKSSPGTVADVLRKVPGLTVEERGGAGGQTLVRLRGAEAQHTLVLIDGIRVNDPASARDTFDFALLSLGDVERIEVLRGPQSALYGSDAMGGVINIVTRRPGREGRKSVTAGGGSYGTRHISGSWSGSQGDGFRALLSGSYFASDGFSRVGDRARGEADATEKASGVFRAELDGPDGVRVELGLDGQHQYAEIDKSASTDAEGYDSERELVSGFARLLAPTHGGRLNHTVTVLTARSARTFGEPTRTTFFRGNSTSLDYRGDLSLGRGMLTFGGKAEAETAYKRRTDKSDPYYDDDRSLYAGYLLYQLPLENLNLSFALRHDAVAGDEGFTTGRVTAVYEMPEHEARIRGSVGTGANLPTAFQLDYNPDLRAETSIGADIGVEKTFHEGRLKASATAFWNTFDNLIDWEGDFYTGTYTNIARAETGGVEVALWANLVPGKLTGSASYTWLHTRDLDTGLPLQRRPQHRGAVTLTYTPTYRLSTSLSAVAVGDRWDDNGATHLLPAYVRVDMTADYKVNGNLSVFGRVENLFDADYEDAAGYNTPGLSAYAGFRWRD